MRRDARCLDSFSLRRQCAFHCWCFSHWLGMKSTSCITGTDFIAGQLWEVRRDCVTGAYRRVRRAAGNTPPLCASTQGNEEEGPRGEAERCIWDGGDVRMRRAAQYIATQPRLCSRPSIELYDNISFCIVGIVLLLGFTIRRGVLCVRLKVKARSVFQCALFDFLAVFGSH